MTATNFKSLTRNSGIELYKLLGLFLICIFHSVQTSELFIDYSPTTNFTIIVLNFFKYFGHVGNIIFIISSSYFLYNSKKSKLKFSKAINILLDSCLISTVIMIAFIGGGYH